MKATPSQNGSPVGDSTSTGLRVYVGFTVEGWGFGSRYSLPSQSKTTSNCSIRLVFSWQLNLLFILQDAGALVVNVGKRPFFGPQGDLTGDSVAALAAGGYHLLTTFFKPRLQTYGCIFICVLLCFTCLFTCLFTCYIYIFFLCTHKHTRCLILAHLSRICMQMQESSTFASTSAS